MGKVLEERLGYRAHHLIIYWLPHRHELPKVVPWTFQNTKKEI